MAARTKTESATMMAPSMNTMTMNSAYSLSAVGNFMNQNFGLLLLAVAVFILGFMTGSLWTENKLLKAGGVAAAQPGAAAGANAQPAPPAQPLNDADWKTVTENPAAVVGNRNAKVTLVEFTDYQCPFCGRHYTDTYGQIKTAYVDTGKVKIVFRDQPLPFHANARIASLAARCAADQGGLLQGSRDKNYEAMHDELFGKQNDWSNLGKDAAITKFGEYASAHGMNAATLTQCVKDEKFGKQVDDDIALANRVGANGTPTFFIEKDIIVGAVPFSEFKTKLDAAL